MLSARSRWLLATTLAAFVVLTLFFAGVGGEFLFDDATNITGNVALYMTGLDHVSAWRAASSFPHGPGLRLIPMLSFGVDYFRTGAFDPAAFKSTNLAIHIVTFFVLTHLFRRLLTIAGSKAPHARWLALFLALIWAIHPLQVSSVLYVVQRMQTLATLFLLLALWAYLTMRQAQLEGRSGWQAGGWAAFCWFLAMASKEDAVLLPAYTLALELTVLRFGAQAQNLARWLKRAYAALTLMGAALFLFWAMPHFASTEIFPGRNFNSLERVLTQGRVLLMYLGQIVWPRPDGMPFYYDDYLVSRSWLTPPATLLAWLFLLSLTAMAWRIRHRRPLFSLGVFWFLSGHFVTSNVLGLELVFEHRNHFPMIGAILATTDMCAVLLSFARHQHKAVGIAICMLALIGCGVGTLQRATDWGDPLRFAQKSVEIAPDSGRAWVDLCQIHFNNSSGRPADPSFNKAVVACQYGGTHTGSVMALVNAIILKSTRGDITTDEWDHFLERLRTTTLTPENRGIAMTLINNANQGVNLDLSKVLTAIDIMDEQSRFSPGDSLVIVRFILTQDQHPARACAYLERAALLIPSDDPVLTPSLLAECTEQPVQHR